MGFYFSFLEMKKNAVTTQGTNIVHLNDNAFIPLSANNVNHNIRTISGRNIFHGIGIIATVTPKIGTFSKRIPTIK